MRKILTLTKVMLKNTSIQTITPKKQKPWQKILTYIGFITLFVILSFSIYFLSKDILLSLQTQNLESIVLEIVMVVFSLYLLISGIITVPIVFYFSKDVEGLLALPLKPFEILSAKAITSYINLLLAASFIVLPFGIAYQFVIQPKIIFSLYYFMAFLIIPILPLAFSLTIIVVFFTLLPKANNKDLFTYFSSILMLVVILGMNIGTSNESLSQLAVENLGLIKSVPTLIPSIGLVSLGIRQLQLLPILGALLLSLVLAYALLVAISNLYFKGVLGAQVSSRKKKRHKRKTQKGQSQLMAIMKSDIRNILRTPSMMINYFLPIVILPLLIFIPLIFSVTSEDLQIMKEVMVLVQDWLKTVDGISLVPYLIFISFILTYFTSSFTAITSTSISREGETMQTYKSMPIEMMLVVKSKIILGMITGAIVPLIFTIMATVFLKLNIIALLIILFSIFIALLFSNTSDILLDLIKPKLEWDDEIQAIKQNFLSIVPIFVSFGLSALFVFIFLKFDPLISSLTILALSSALSVFNYKIVIEKYGLKKLDQAIQEL